MKSYYRVMLGKNSDHAEACFEGGFIGTNFGIAQDLTHILSNERREFIRRVNAIFFAYHPEKTYASARQSCGALWTVSKGIEQGDMVLCPDGTGSYRVGEITGEYYYEPDQILFHRRPVKWLTVKIRRTAMTEGLRRLTGLVGTVRNITAHAAEVEHLIWGPRVSGLSTLGGKVKFPGTATVKEADSMHVQSITLTNVRQFDQITYRFQSGFNLLVGENGAGKTTLLRSMLAVLGSAKQTGRRPALDDDDIRLRAFGLRIDAEIADERGKILSVPHYEKKLAKRARRSRNPGDLLVLLYASNEATCGSFLGRRIKRYGSSLSADIRSSEEAIFDIEHGTETGIAPDLRFGRSREIRSFVLKMLSGFSRDFRDFTWSFEPYDCAIRPPPQKNYKPTDFDVMRRRLTASIMRYLQESKELRQWPDQARIIFDSSGIQLGAGKSRGLRIPKLEELLFTSVPDTAARTFLESSTIEIRLTPRIVIRSAQGTLLLHQLSDGQQRIFSIFADIARRLSIQSGADQMHEASAIVLIDEIDVHLHPTWQRKIVPALEDLFPACQFIATTHSPFIIQATKQGQVQQIDGSAIGDVADRGIEEITAKVMGIEDHQVSPRYLDMLDTAKEYFRLLETVPGVRQEGHVTELRQKLRNLSQRYAENPAYQAYLEVHGKLALGPDELR